MVFLLIYRPSSMARFLYVPMCIVSSNYLGPLSCIKSYIQPMELKPPRTKDIVKYPPAHIVIELLCSFIERPQSPKALPSTLIVQVRVLTVCNYACLWWRNKDLGYRI